MRLRLVGERLAGRGLRQPHHPDAPHRAQDGFRHPRRGRHQHHRPARELARGVRVGVGGEGVHSCTSWGQRLFPRGEPTRGTHSGPKLQARTWAGSWGRALRVCTPDTPCRRRDNPSRDTPGRHFGSVSGVALCGMSFMGVVGRRSIMRIVACEEGAQGSCRFLGSDFGCGADFRGPDTIRWIASGLQNWAPRPKSEPEKRNVVQVRALGALFLGQSPENQTCYPPGHPTLDRPGMAETVQITPKLPKCRSPRMPDSCPRRSRRAPQLRGRHDIPAQLLGSRGRVAGEAARPSRVPGRSPGRGGRSTLYHALHGPLRPCCASWWGYQRGPRLVRSGARRAGGVGQGSHGAFGAPAIWNFLVGAFTIPLVEIWESEPPIRWSPLCRYAFFGLRIRRSVFADSPEQIASLILRRPTPWQGLLPSTACHWRAIQQWILRDIAESSRGELHRVEAAFLYGNKLCDVGLLGFGCVRGVALYGMSIMGLVGPDILSARARIRMMLRLSGADVGQCANFRGSGAIGERIGSTAKIGVAKHGM